MQGRIWAAVKEQGVPGEQRRVRSTIRKSALIKQQLKLLYFTCVLKWVIQGCFSFT